MTPFTKTVAGFVAVAALAVPIGLSVLPASASTDPGATPSAAPADPGTAGSSTTTPATPATNGRTGRRLLTPDQRKQRRATRIDALAKELGVSSDDLRAALRSVRAERPEGGFSSRVERITWLEEHLATALGIEPAKVHDAVVKLITQRVDAAVANGRITQRRADRIRERIAEAS